MSEAHTRSIPAKVRHFLALSDDAKCLRCGRPRSRAKLEINHLIPFADGGPTDSTNLVTLCALCHKKAPRNFVDFAKWLRYPFPPPLDTLVQGFEMGWMNAFNYIREEPARLHENPEATFNKIREDANRILQALYSVYEREWEE